MDDGDVYVWERDRCMVTGAIQMIGVRAVPTAPLRDFCARLRDTDVSFVIDFDT